MASSPNDGPLHNFAAGDHVAVIDASSRFHCTAGVVAFFVGDNIYVRFPGRSRSPLKMFFAEQLRAAIPAQPTQRLVSVSSLFGKLRISLGRFRP